MTVTLGRLPGPPVATQPLPRGHAEPRLDVRVFGAWRPPGAEHPVTGREFACHGVRCAGVRCWICGRPA